MKRKRKRIQRSDIAWMLFALLMVLLQFWWLPGRAERPDDSYSTSVDGKLGLYRVLRELYPNVKRETEMAVPESPCTLLLLSPDRYPNQREEAKLYEFIYSGGTLIFAPNWTDDEYYPSQLPFKIEPRDRAGVSRSREETSDRANNNQGGGKKTPDDRSVESDSSPPSSEQNDIDSDDENERETGSASDSFYEFDVTSDLVEGEIPWRASSQINMRMVQDKDLVVSDQQVEVAARALGRGAVIVCSSPYVFSNRALLDPQQAELAVRIIEYAQETGFVSGPGPTQPVIVINEYFNLSGSYRYTGVLFSPALRAGTLQLMLLGVLAAWIGFHRFGPPRQQSTLERRSLVDSAVAVGNLQFRSHDAGDVVRAYLDYLRNRLLRLYGSSVRLDDVAGLAARTGMDQQEIAELLKRAESIAHSPKVGSAAAADVIRSLSGLRYRLEHSRERQRKG